jgi:ubiquinone/menaquinone biosynthesis C-methylase UbiE
MKSSQTLVANSVKLIGMLCILGILIYIYSKTRMVILLLVAPLIIFINFKKLFAFKDSLQDSIYNKIMMPFTQKLYKLTIPIQPKGIRILDVGVGNGISLLSCSECIRQNDYHIVGIDINPASIEIAKANIKKYNMEEHVSAECQNLYQYKSEKYDMVFFSDCWAVIPDSKQMVKFSMNFLKPNGKITVVTTLDDKATFMKRVVKPKVEWIFGKMSSFGRVTTYNEMEEYLKENFANYDIKQIYYDKIGCYGEIKTYMINIYNDHNQQL